jgi:aspartyl-tRNA(Asn)/glutamyl-tRNA(Gln) amidotransferase subunit A
MCGIFGLKPTFGRVPLEGAMPLSPSIDCAGPLAATAGDLGTAFRVLSGSADTGSRPRRIGRLRGFFDELVHPDVRDAVDAVESALREAGYDVADADGSGAEPLFEGWPDFVCMELVEAHPRLPDLRELLFPRTAGFVARGLNLTDEERTTLRGLPAKAREWFAQRLDTFDVLIGPSAPYPAPRADEDDVEVGEGRRVDVHLGGTSSFTRPGSLAGVPGLTIPAGLGARSGMPVGVQLTAAWGQDETLLALAAELEAATFTAPPLPPERLPA